jgi:predicted DNA-binding transcriptional regulator AlpA
MGDSLDTLFLHPRAALTARKIDVYDAINLVVYAKRPLIDKRRGKETVAGFISLDGSRSVVRVFVPQFQMREFLSKYERVIESFRYPVSPAQYEPLLERMVAAREFAIPYFFHEHHYLLEKRRRAALFATLHAELGALVSKGDVVLQLTDSERTRLMAGHSWMTAETLRTYLNLHGVVPWWEEEENLVTHSRLERVLLSDGLNLVTSDSPEESDSQQLPSYLFGQMLLQRTRIPSGKSQAREAVVGAEAVELRRSGLEPSASHDKPRRPTAAPVVTTSPSNESTLEIIKASPSADPERAKNPDGTRSEAAIDEARPERHFAEDAPPQTSATPLDQDEAMLTKSQVAEFLGVSVNTVDNRRNDDPDFPQAAAYTRNSLRWKRSEIRQWRDRKKTK